MAFEKLGAGALSEDDAHDEANMVRARLGVSPETGKLPADRTHTEEHEPTAEDYDNALKSLEDLRMVILKNPYSVSVFDQIVSMPFLGAAFLARLAKAMAGKPDEIAKRWQEGAAWSDLGVEAVFGEAETELLRLKASGRTFAKGEATRGKKGE